MTSAKPALTPSPPVFTDYLASQLQQLLASFFALKTQKPAPEGAGLGNEVREAVSLFLPRAFFVSIGLKPLSTLMFRHLEATLLLQITHGFERLKEHRAERKTVCKVQTKG